METNLNDSARVRPETPADQTERAWTIGEMAREFHVSLRALRFYEDRALLHPRRMGTTRLYFGHDRRQLQMILRAKQLGFTLAEIREILARGDSEADLNIPPEQIVAQISHLERQLSTLEAALAELRLAHARASAAAA
jgi:DNA-binding transcriptional MerR regulator